MPRTIHSVSSLAEARAAILALAGPGEPIEVSLCEALGLVLAEPIVADADHPPTDRSAVEGYAVRSAEAGVGALLRVVGSSKTVRPSDALIEAGEAFRVSVGDPMPIGADGVVRRSGVRPDPGPEAGPARVVEVVDPGDLCGQFTPRGAFLRAGDPIVEAGRAVDAGSIALLASQGAVAPICHRRVRVSIVGVGRHWVGPNESPTMHRERNAVNSTLVALTARADAMPQDYRSVSGPAVGSTIDRSLGAPIVVIVGAPSGRVRRHLDAIGCEEVVKHVRIAGCARTCHGVIRDEFGQVAHHVFQVPPGAVAASVAFSLLVRPLIDRLAGRVAPSGPRRAVLESDRNRRTRGAARALPARLRWSSDGRAIARIVDARGTDDVARLAGATGLVVLGEGAGPWRAGDLVDYVAFD